MDYKFEDILYEKKENIAKITINRPEVLNAIRTVTLREIAEALQDAELDCDIRVVVITGSGDKAFCVGGDAKEISEGAGYGKGNGYWHTQVHRAIRYLEKPVIAAVNGLCIGGGNILQLMCDLTIAADTAKFGQAGPRVGSFDAGYGIGLMARVIGEKRAREVWFLCRQYSASEAIQMGMVNKAVPKDELEHEVAALCKEIIDLSPTALKFLKISLATSADGMFGLEAMSMASVELYWGTDEAKEWKETFWQKRLEKTDKKNGGA